MQIPRPIPPALRVGFSLIELVIVIAILAILIGLAIPAILGVRVESDRRHCAHNLNQIGVAYHLCIDEKNNKSGAFRSDPTWMDQLKPFLDGNEAFFVCKSDKHELANAAIVPLTPPIHLINVRADPHYLIPVSQPAGGGQTGWPWNDPIIVVKPKPGGGVQIDLSYGTTGKPPVLKGGDLPDPDLPPPLPKQLPYSTTTSYGVNCQAQYFRLDRDSDKVLVVEYRKVVANVVGPHASDNWVTDSAPRHRGALNVLFRDGSVRDMGQFEIDPGLHQIYRKHWLPAVFEH